MGREGSSIRIFCIGNADARGSGSICACMCGEWWELGLCLVGGAGVKSIGSRDGCCVVEVGACGGVVGCLRWVRKE